MSSLPFAKDLEAIFSSEKIPLMGVMANQKITTANERDRLTKALAEMCKHQQGKKLCDLFGLQSFTPANLATYQKMIDLWEAGTHQ